MPTPRQTSPKKRPAASSKSRGAGVRGSRANAKSRSVAEEQVSKVGKKSKAQGKARAATTKAASKAGTSSAPAAGRTRTTRATTQAASEAPAAKEKPKQAEGDVDPVAETRKSSRTAYMQCLKAVLEGFCATRNLSSGGTKKDLTERLVDDDKFSRLLQARQYADVPAAYLAKELERRGLKKPSAAAGGPMAALVKADHKAAVKSRETAWLGLVPRGAAALAADAAEYGLEERLQAAASTEELAVWLAAHDQFSRTSPAERTALVRRETGGRLLLRAKGAQVNFLATEELKKTVVKRAGFDGAGGEAKAVAELKKLTGGADAPQDVFEVVWALGLQKKEKGPKGKKGGRKRQADDGAGAVVGRAKRARK